MATLWIGDGRCLPWVMLVTLSSLGSIFIVDYYFEIASPDLIVAAVLDEYAHLATATIFLLGLWRVLNLWFSVACLAGAVLIDVDHLPAMLSAEEFALQAERPVTHSVVWLIGLFILGISISGKARAIVLGLSLGIATHLFRDMATGGIPLFWPFTGDIIDTSYWLFAVVIISVALLPLPRYLLGALTADDSTRAWKRSIDLPRIRQSNATHSARSSHRSGPKRG